MLDTLIEQDKDTKLYDQICRMLLGEKELNKVCCCSYFVDDVVLRLISVVIVVVVESIYGSCCYLGSVVYLSSSALIVAGLYLPLDRSKMSFRRRYRRVDCTISEA